MSDLISAIKADDVDAVESLLEGMADAKVSDADGNTGVHHGAMLKSVDMIKVLLDAGADINAQNNDGATALMLAVKEADADCVEMLMNSGADATLQDKDGKAADSMTTDEELLAYLTESGSSVASMGAAPVVVPVSKPNRRVSVSSESYNESQKYEIPVHAKSEDAAKRIATIVNANFLFSSIDKENKKKVVDAMYEVTKCQGEEIITQGDREANEFYVVESGQVDCFKTFPNGETKKVKEIGAGGSFGELALMYNTPRAATVKAAEAVVLWAMDRDTFRGIVLKATIMKRKKFEGFLEKVKLLQDMDTYERASIADGLMEQEYKAGDVIITQGEAGDTFFIMMTGTAKAFMSEGGNPETEVATYAEGDYFGELALLLDQPRAAKVVALTDCTCATCDRSAFERLLGQAKEILKRSADNYASYEDILKKA